jgi:hypothetical protein
MKDTEMHSHKVSAIHCCILQVNYTIEQNWAIDPSKNFQNT